MKPIYIVIGLVVVIFGCKSSDPKPEIIEAPSEVDLIFPFENSECNEGTDVTLTQSTVLFEWLASENTDEYELNVINLFTDVQSTFSTGDIKFPVVLQRATPYAWYVKARSNQTDSTAQSDTWKFYNTGDGIENYAPFPADIISPVMAQRITAPSGNITLDWSGSDVDNDIVGYDVYFGTESSPPLLDSNITASEINVSVNPGTVYYWSVTTVDAEGHQSETVIFQFRIE